MITITESTVLEDGSCTSCKDREIQRVFLIGVGDKYHTSITRLCGKCAAGLARQLAIRLNLEHPCPECEIGTLKETVVDFPSTNDDGQPIVIPSTLILRCNCCGQELIPADTLEKIEAAEARKE